MGHRNVIVFEVGTGQNQANFASFLLIQYSYIDLGGGIEKGLTALF